MRILLIAISLLCTTAAFADGSSSAYGMGGRFRDFDPIVAKYNSSGERFRIQGHCQSACTIFLSIRNVCVERSAQLLFHAGHDQARNVSKQWTDHMLNHYNARLRTYLVSNHYMDDLSFHSISGAELIDRFGYRECR